jgi:hypothetical protein
VRLREWSRADGPGWDAFAGRPQDGLDRRECTKRAVVTVGRSERLKNITPASPAPASTSWEASAASSQSASASRAEQAEYAALLPQLMAARDEAHQALAGAITDSSAQDVGAAAGRDPGRRKEGQAKAPTGHHP